MCILCDGGAFLNEGFKERSDAGLARERKTHKPQNQKSFCEERKGRRERDEERKAPSEAFGAVCACAQWAIERERWAGLKRARPQAHMLRASPFKKTLKRRAKAQNQPSNRLLRLEWGCTTTHPHSVKVSECHFYTFRVLLTFFFLFL